MTETSPAVPLPHEQADPRSAVLHAVLQRLHETGQDAPGEEDPPVVVTGGSGGPALVRRVRR